MSKESPVSVEIGSTLRHLNVIGIEEKHAEVRCVCGVIKKYPIRKLETGTIHSCGCRRGKASLVEAFGETKNIRNWSQDERCKVGYTALVQRISRGWDAEKAIATAVVPKWDSNKYRKNWNPRRKTEDQRHQEDVEYVEQILAKNS